MKYPTPELLVQITNSDDLDSFKSSFQLYNRLVCSMLIKSGSNIKDVRTILDFGCGVGRLFYALDATLTDGQKMFGCDLNARAVSWCRDNVGYADVVQNSTRSGLPYSDGMFDVVVAVSVFTHLSLELQEFWAAEMRRIIRPGGHLMMSTHGPSWFPVFIENRLTHPSAADLKVSHLGGDALFADLRFSGAIDADPQGQREVATAHTRAAIEFLFDDFDVVCHESRSELAGHDLYFLCRS
jgi:SAM-dependent methyltransferase